MIIFFEDVMKEKLKKQFNGPYWVQTFEMRSADLKKGLPAISVHSHWPYLFKPEGVIYLIKI